MKPTQIAIKALIEIAKDIEYADKLIEEYTPHRTFDAKLAYLLEIFDTSTLPQEGDCSDAYWGVLLTIIDGGR